MNEAKSHITSCSDRPMQSFTQYALVLHCPRSLMSPHRQRMAKGCHRITSGKWPFHNKIFIDSETLNFFSTYTDASFCFCQASFWPWSHNVPRRVRRHLQHVSELSHCNHTAQAQLSLGSRSLTAFISCLSSYYFHWLQQ